MYSKYLKEQLKKIQKNLKDLYKEYSIFVIILKIFI